ncbi:MAG: hypothetical protein J6A38_00985 [Clostridia bacterium]|nr:hypothetical protein [Clostridia bacterium]
MSKILGKTVKKATLLSIVLAAIFALATIIGIFFGFNKSVAMEDTKSVTVSMNQFAYSTMLDDVKEDCSTVFKGLDIEYVMEGEMSGDESEIVYVFDKDAKDEKIAVAYKVLKEIFAEKTKTGGVWDGTFINVTYGNEELATAIADEYVARGIIAGVVLLVLAFVYVSIRYKLNIGALTALCTLLGMLLTTSLIVLTRIPVTLSVTYVIFGSALLSAVMSLMTYNKIRANKNNEEGLSAEELVTAGIAVNEIVLTTVFFGIALLVVGIVATTAVRWFAVSALVAVLASAIIGLIYAPAFYLPVKKAMDKKPARPGAYQGAKKTSKKTKKVVVEETPAEEVVEETPAEEVVAEVDETPVEETEVEQE